MNFLESDQELDTLLAKHEPKLTDIDQLIKFIGQADEIKSVLTSATKIFSSADDAMACYTNQDDILLYFEKIQAYGLYETVPDKINISGKVHQLVNCQFKQKIVVNIVNFDDIKIRNLLMSPGFTIEGIHDMVAELTVESSLHENYEAAKQEFDQSLALKIPAEHKHKVFMPKIRESGTIKYFIANVTDAIRLNPLGFAKNRQQLKTITAPPVEPEVAIKKQPDYLSNNKQTVDWVTGNNPDLQEEKLDYFARYIKSSGPAISQMTFTRIMKQLNFQEIKKGKKTYWSKV